MIEDKLSHDERLRLEAVAQSVARSAGRPTGIDAILEEAARIATFVAEPSQATTGAPETVEELQALLPDAAVEAVPRVGDPIRMHELVVYTGLAEDPKTGKLVAYDAS